MMFRMMTKLLMFATLLHVYLIVLKEYDKIRREYKEAQFVHIDTCSDPIRRMKYGRFHNCDDVNETLAVTSLVLTAMDRAFLRFFTALKTRTLDDLNHMGMLVLTLSLVACVASYVASNLYRMWAYHSVQRKYGERRAHADDDEQKHIAIRVSPNQKVYKYE